MNLRRGSLLLALLSSCGAAPPSPPPDVVLLVIDTQRADRLGCYGYERPTSPIIDGLVGGGVLFEDATAQSSWTQPSMASMFTGRYLSRQATGPENAVPTLAELFSEAGYRTLGFSANVLVSPKKGFDRGFDHYDSEPHELLPGGGFKTRDGKHLVDAVWPVLGDCLSQADRPPVFLFVQFFDPHAPYLPIADWDAELPLTSQSSAEDFDWHRSVYPRSLEGKTGQRALALMDRMRAIYDQEVREADRWIGELLDRAAAAGLGDNAVFALASDHGEGLWDHITPGADEAPQPPPPAEFFHQEHTNTMFQELVHTPLALWGTGVPSGLRVATPVENIDLMPTLLDLAGLDRPDSLHGQNLLAVASGAAAPREYLFSVSLDRALVRETSSDLTLLTIDEGWPGAGTELYALGTDPIQRDDLAADRPGDVDRLLQRLEQWRTDYPVGETSSAPLSDEERQRLEQLGYQDILLEGAGE